MKILISFLWVLFLGVLARGYRYDPEYIAYNLNTNRTATDPTDYWGQRYAHQYTASPDNWRFPFYTLFLDRFVNADPFNDNINGTFFEHDINNNQIRHGGDLRGLEDTLDYLHGMGVRGLFLAGSIFLNQPWGYDGYSPIDLTLLDPHFGDLRTWNIVVDAIHARGMYLIVDNTFSTLGDLIGFEGFLNATAPFYPEEHRALYKSSRQYLDFSLSNEYNATCDYPRFWNETGFPVDQSVYDQFKGCYNSEFDQYGDTEAFGVYPDWRRQLTKFASVQDRLREWHTPTRKKLENFYCMMIAQLDIDGFRFDKAMQSTIDAFGEFNYALRNCARQHGKENFFLAGEITAGNSLASVWLGRGRQPDMLPNNLTEAITAGFSTQAYSLREPSRSALDAAAFHYSVYRTLTRFLGMDGNLEAGYDVPFNLVDLWNTLLMTNDFTNANTGEFDPRHMYGTVNPDLFRWPAIKNGVQRQLLGNFVTTLMLPGIPLLLWGEEQAFYVLDNTASNYIFGRQPMSASSAWQTHGCYSLDSTQYYQYPVESARHGCHDDKVSYDHRDPAAPVRNIYKHMYYLREQFPVLKDGAWLQQLSNQTWEVIYPGSSGLATETGMWSVMRSGVPGVQNFTTEQIIPGNTPVWLLYSNDNTTKDFQFNCSDATPAPHTTALLSPFDGGSTLQNLLHPYDIVQLENSTQFLGLNGSTNATGCLRSVTMEAYGHKAYVPIEYWVAPQPAITRFMVNDDPNNGHDARLLSRTPADDPDQVVVQFYFSSAMDCRSVSQSISVKSKTLSGRSANFDFSSVTCGFEVDVPDVNLQGVIPSVWSWSGTLVDVEDGTHEITVDDQFKDSVDHFLFRIGQPDNPVVFPRSANYSSTLVQQDESGRLYLHHAAAGASLWRYTTNWGSSFSPWTPYTGENTTIDELDWSGTRKQAWKGKHVRVEYFNRMAGTSDIVQEGDLENLAPRRFPHLFWNGPYNAYGFDSGLDNEFRQISGGKWEHQFMTEWPALAQINVWGMNPDGQPDQTYVLGDTDGDSVLDRLPPSSLAATVINITAPPVKPYLAWTVTVDDATRRFELRPSGSSLYQIIVISLLSAIPILTALAAVFAFMKGFYQVKFNQIGMTDDPTFLPAVVKEKIQAIFSKEDGGVVANTGEQPSRLKQLLLSSDRTRHSSILTTGKSREHRRTVLIGTMEYDIEDWKIKVKIGGLGVMAQLMGKALGHQELIWVVPCIGGVDYPVDTPAEPMKVTILGVDYSVQVQYHQLKNIKYVLLDAPVFRQQTQAEPYPARMDDMTSAIYYSAWNQCLAQTIRRFPIDLYHINDYHGCIAPLYLLPHSIPVCLSLHNAEFQGLWPMRTPDECTEVSEVFNLTPDVIQRFVQFGEIFNLLHAGASYLRVYQQGFGAVGVSKKYGRRAHLRYPIFWGLRKIGQLPNPDPTDTAEWDGRRPREEDIKVDPVFEAARPGLRVEAQRWAGLEEDPDAELFVFVGRWTMQKGVDLIADVFPSILKKYPKTQLICVGPVVDLYGKFAALKLEKLMKLYPKRVFSRPVFTALPPCIFAGAEFALIPSRDEPFGLVAVEFGRKGALGVGARVGGLGNMPGWWYTMEAVTTTHLLHQFRLAIEAALSSKPKLRAIMRARSAKQRFPVAQWVEDLDILQSTSIRVHGKVSPKHSKQNRLSSRISEVNVEDADRARREDTPTPDSALVSPMQTPISSYPSQPTHRIRRKPVSFASETDVSDARSAFVTSSERSSPDLDESNERRDIVNASASNSSFRPAVSRRSVSTPSLPSYVSDISLLATDAVVGDSKEYQLQQVDPFFTDSQGTYQVKFSRMLDKADSLQGSSLCIEEYLIKSEKDWFQQFLNAKLGRESKALNSSPSKANTFRYSMAATSAIWSFATRTPAPSTKGDVEKQLRPNSSGSFEQFLLGDDYKAPRYIRKWMQLRIGNWPVYSFFLALGQIMAANSYQITLLTGQNGQAAERVYVLCGLYMVASILLWLLFRRVQSVIVLSIPFIFYGLAFFIMGVARFGNSVALRGWIQNIATGCYALASASGSLYFSLNFGDEGGSTVRTWIFRACVIQGLQQVYVTALWFWGTYLSRQATLGLTTYSSNFLDSWKITAICMPIAGALWLVGATIFFGLPNYYRQAPGRVPSFYRSALRREIILWFFATVAIQNFFLSAQYGRSWSFLWSSQHASAWHVVCLVAFFFIVLWAMILWCLSVCSRSHSWLLPILAIGLGAPRWAQIWWGVSGAGSYLPWTGGYLASALASRSLWLWLGVLDTVQSVGIGMMLLSTMTRLHVTFTLITAQVVGAAVTAIARAWAPNNLGPGPIFPNVVANARSAFNAWFWLGLLLNCSVCIGFFLFFRKSQLQKA